MKLTERIRKRRGPAVVIDEQHALLVCHCIQCWRIDNGKSGARYGLHVQDLVITDEDRIANLFNVGDVDEDGADRAGSGEEVGEDGVGTIAEAARSDDV